MKKNATTTPWDLVFQTGGTLLLAVALFGVLMLPDVMLASQGIDLNGLSRPRNLVTVLGVALLLSLVASRKARLWILAFLVLNQVVWIGCAVYFGKTLGPEQLLLAQYEVSDTITGALAEWQSLLPAIGAVLTCGGLAGALVWPALEGRVYRSPFAVWGFAAAVIGASAFWSLHKRIEVAFPGTDTPSVYGPLQAMVSVVRIASTTVSAAVGTEIKDQQIRALPPPGEPQTVVVIMGESINAYRLSLFGFPSDTTPRLKAWKLQPPAGFTFIPKIGVSGGTATFGSVPTFIRMSYIPVGAEDTGINLFDLASKSGFKNWFLSAQNRQFLDVAGGAKNAVRIETDHGNETRLAAKADDLLVDFAREVQDGADKRFVFVHQRVNHAGYKEHCEHAPEGMYIFDRKIGGTAGRRRADYDNGLRCWDRNVTSLASQFLSEAGAVHIFMLSDHSELMGEAGLWGHGFPDVRASMVPMLLLTNRPQSDIARQFAGLSPPTTYGMARTVARALGFEVSTPGETADQFFLNSTMPFGLAGYMEVDRLNQNRFRVTTYARNGQRMKTNELDLPELATSELADSHTKGETSTLSRD